MKAATTLDKEIFDYIPRLNIKQKQTVLKVVKTFMEDKRDWWDEIIEEQQNAIDKSLTEMKAGKLTPNDEVMKKYRK
ncbi:MAG: hypothetical protein M3R50_09240 [Bacteroidota bacterium]|nr:hypothetical protein [Bacteroidota bacterium]